MSSKCLDCEWMQVDNRMNRRCYSPQLRKLGVPGIIIVFERDDAPEDGRSHEAGTGKCGPLKLNFKRKIGL